MFPRRRDEKWKTVKVWVSDALSRAVRSLIDWLRYFKEIQTEFDSLARAIGDLRFHFLFSLKKMLTSSFYKEYKIYEKMVVIT